jgi:hypothetical protein
VNELVINWHLSRILTAASGPHFAQHGTGFKAGPNEAVAAPRPLVKAGLDASDSPVTIVTELMYEVRFGRANNSQLLSHMYLVNINQTTRRHIPARPREPRTSERHLLEIDNIARSVLKMVAAVSSETLAIHLPQPIFTAPSASRRLILDGLCPSVPPDRRQDTLIISSYFITHYDTCLAVLNKISLGPYQHRSVSPSLKQVTSLLAGYYANKLVGQPNSSATRSIN